MLHYKSHMYYYMESTKIHQGMDKNHFCKLTQNHLQLHQHALTMCILFTFRYHKLGHM